MLSSSHYALSFSAILAFAVPATAIPSVPVPQHPHYSSKDMANYRKPSKAELHMKLTPEQYAVTQNAATESPFHNEYWDNHKPGIYVDVVSGEPLFSSTDKFESGTGWPSFTKPLVPANIRTKTDHMLGYARIEVRSTHADSHLGHLFDDGPKPLGTRYCMNSASLRFVPVDQMQAEGYGEFLGLFRSKGVTR
jgi:methionine-R-sulfoxide reductase